MENILYLALWGVLYAAPVLSTYVRMVNGDSDTFRWQEVLTIWSQFTPFLVLFLIHDTFLAPLIVHEHKPFTYGSIVAVVIGAFIFYQCNTEPVRPFGDKHHMHNGLPMGERPPMHPGMEGADEPPLDRGDRAHQDETPPPPPRHDRQRRHTPPPAIIGQHDIVAVTLLILLLGLNVGCKFYFKHRGDEKKLMELEKESLVQQLEYLKYQLNPHFLMNTLNNIHALVEIDAERAQEAIIHLSKILRYVLYESNTDRVPATKEMEFMENYVTLMRMRYTDKLRFTVTPPEDGMDAQLPPLLFISFVENAFKHGVSYQEESFIEVTGKKYKGKRGEARLLWTCRNSKHAAAAAPQSALVKEGGVGLVNVRRRLDLIFGNDYSLGVNETDKTYEVILDFPLEA